MDPANAIEIVGITKEFRVFERGYGNLKAQTMHAARRLLHRDVRTRFQPRVALAGISLNVPKGQTIALIGHNGSGKSTMLSILARIYLPSSGEVRIRGRVSSMLELGIGFNEELTGVENIFFSCTMRGMSREQTAAKFESIRAFSELDDATLALPMRMYSSGMLSRVAFSVAVHIDSDIVLIDEGLAVGDVAFQEKCLTKLDSMRREGKTIFVVTHNANFHKLTLDRAVWLIKGRVHRDGPAPEVLKEYTAHMAGKNPAPPSPPPPA